MPVLPFVRPQSWSARHRPGALGVRTAPAPATALAPAPARSARWGAAEPSAVQPIGPERRWSNDMEEFKTKTIPRGDHAEVFNNIDATAMASSRKVNSASHRPPSRPSQPDQN